jgi:hypothetical protein
MSIRMDELKALLLRKTFIGALGEYLFHHAVNMTKRQHLRNVLARMVGAILKAAEIRLGLEAQEHVRAGRQGLGSQQVEEVLLRIWAPVMRQAPSVVSRK